MTLILWAVIGYLLGAIPFGIVLTRLMGLGDLRQIGSGNIGATNVLRTGHKGAALATLILDSGKGAAAVLLARAIEAEDAALVAAVAAFLGHLFSIWLRFKGGKGVATFLGTLLALDWRVGLLACLIWLACALLTRISSLSALTAAALTPLIAWAMTGGELAICTAIMAILIFDRHRANIARIANGTEPRIGRKG